MKTHIRSVLSRVVAFVLLIAVLIIPQAAQAVTSQSLAVPLYERPDKGTYWSDITKVGGSTVPFVVANPANGPGMAADAAYTSAIGSASTAGTRTFGYVQTNYQARPFKDAYADIDAWYKLYPNTKGIFVDLIKEGSTPEVCYIAGLYTHVKNVRPNDTVVLGAGSHISAAYEPYGDIFLNASSDYGTYQSWRVQYPGFEDKPLYQNRFWHIVHGVESARYSDAFDMVRGNNAGWTFITDKTQPTPFTATPAYWQNEVSDVGNLPASSIPNRGKTALPRGCISLSQSVDSTVDTTVPKLSKTTSAITVNNTSQTYDSEPTTQLQLLNIPAGATLNSISGNGWTCTLTDKKSCSYNAVLPASSSSSLTANFQASCDFSEGEAVLRLVNYAGNQWDVTIPLKPPIGCDPSTAAGRVNTDSVGQVLSITTQSVETTPEVTPLGGDDSVADSKPEVSKKGLSTTKIVLLVVLGIVLLGVIALIAVMLYQRRRYKVDI